MSNLRLKNSPRSFELKKLRDKAGYMKSKSFSYLSKSKLVLSKVLALEDSLEKEPSRV